jgi:integrase
MSRLTKRTLDALQPSSSDYFVWDEELKGFGVRVSPKNTKTFLVQYRAGGRQRRVKVGRYGPLTADEARLEARALLGDVAKGDNPAEEIATERRAPTVAEVADRFVRDHVAVRIKPSTARNYVAFMTYVVKPRWGVRKIADVTRADITALHHSYRDRPYQANRMLCILSKFFNLAEVWGLRPDGSNPCRRIQKYPEAKRERFLSTDELARLGRVLAESEASGAENPYVVAAFRLLLLTGCRRGEIQFLKWEYITPSHILLPDSKTGARKIPLPPAAQEVLRRLPRPADNPYVICGELRGLPMNDLEKPWRRIRARAELSDVRIHDLRHTYASNAVMAGLSIPMVGKILGHTQVQTTMRYAHFADDPVREAAKLVSDGLSLALQTLPARPRLTVVPS